MLNAERDGAWRDRLFARELVVAVFGMRSISVSISRFSFYI